MAEARDESASISAAPAGDAWRPSFNPWLIAFSVMLATFMEVLDTSVANVALPHIAGSLAATTTEATWVLTSYLVSNAIILPSTGWLSGRFGRKRLLIACIIIFTVASVICGAAASLGMLIVARVVQGAGGGALQPIAQAVLLESFPPERRGPAMAAYGVGVVVAPIIGPTLGGWITDNYTWRWIFYINLPVGILATIMAYRFVEDPPYIRASRGIKMDYIGFALMAIGLAALQVMLDKGQEDDWFSSTFIRTLAVTAGVCLVAFIVWELITATPIVELRIFKDRNFATGTFMIAAVGLVLYGSTALLPLFLQTLLGYPAFESGLAVSPRGLGSLLAMIVVGRLTMRVDSRFLLIAGFAGLAYATYWFSTLNLEISMINVVWPNILTGAALGFIFVPLTTTTMGTLPNEQIRNGTGIYNLMRNVGGSFGIALVTTYVERGSQTYQANLARNITPFSPLVQETLHGITAALTPKVGAVRAAHDAVAILYNELLAQAHLLAYMNDFRQMALMCLACIPLVFLFRRARPRRGPVAAH